MAHNQATRRIFRRDQATSNSASASSTPFFISDTSPLLYYGSSAASSSSSPWTAGYAKQSDGYDETLHLSSASNSIIAFNVTASSLTLLVPSYKDCKATISINASSPIPACSIPVSTSSSEVIPFTLYNLPTGSHNVIWDSGSVPIGEQVIFWGIDGIRPIEKSGYSNITIDDAFHPIQDVNVGIRYEGDWTHLNSNTHSDALVESGNLDNDFNKTLAITQSKGSAVTFFGSGTAVYIYGTVGPNYGAASISINGQVVAPFLNLTSPWQMPYELLWFQTGLDNSQTNQVTMTNLGDRKMALDFVVLTTDSDTLSQLVTGDSDGFLSSLKGKLVLGIAIPLIVIILLSLLTVWIFRQRRFTRRRRNSRESTTKLRPTTNGGLSDHSTEKPFGSHNSNSTRSVASFDDVFVSYDEALQQRLSERWRSPISPSNSNGTGTTRTPRSPENGTGTNMTNGSSFSTLATGTASAHNGLTSVPENMISSPDRVRSLLGSQYAATNPPDSRRGTALPAYTPEGTYVSQFTPTGGDSSANGQSPITAYETLTGTTPTNTNHNDNSAENLTNPAMPITSAALINSNNNASSSSSRSRFPTAAEEKAAQLALFKRFESESSSANSNISPNSTPPQNRSGPSGVERTPESQGNNRVSNTPSDILSIFGTAPGSEGRLSTLTDWTATTPLTSQSPFLPRPGSELDNYPIPINQTRPLKIPSPNSGPVPLPNTNNNNRGLTQQQPVRPKVDMTFLNKNTNTSSSSGSSSNMNPNINSKAKHPFLISPAQIHPSSSSSSNNKLNITGNGIGSGHPNLPPSSYSNVNTPTTIHTPSASSEYSQSTGITQKHHRRNQSQASAFTERSAARPDSDIIPFENFFSGLQRSHTREEGR